MSEPKTLYCPSAPADKPGAEVFGVVLGEPSAPRVQYLSKPQPVNPELSQALGNSRPGEVLRVRSPCAERGCVHFTGQNCSLGGRVAQQPHAATGKLPACAIRTSCRWFAEQGKEVCFRCTEIVTERIAPSLHLDLRLHLPVLR